MFYFLPILKFVNKKYCKINVKYTCITLPKLSFSRFILILILSQKLVLNFLIAVVRTSQNVKHRPGEPGGELAALTVVVLHSLGPPTEVIGGWTEGAGVPGRASAAAAGQTVHPGEEVLFEPSKQLQHQEVFYSKFTFYKQEGESVGLSESLFKRTCTSLFACSMIQIYN